MAGNFSITNGMKFTHKTNATTRLYFEQSKQWKRDAEIEGVLRGKVRHTLRWTERQTNRLRDFVAGSVCVIRSEEKNFFP